MNAIIISIGDELVSGQTIDTNSAYLAVELARRGIPALRHVTVGDDREAIRHAIVQACADADLVIISGGLGPTADDLTRDALADALGCTLRLDARCIADLEAWFAARGRVMVETNRVQAMIPLAAEPIENKVGTAPGLKATLGTCRIFVTPGVPHEMRWMFEHHIAATLPSQAGVIEHRILHTFGAGESDVGQKIEPLMRRGANPTVGTTVAAGLVSVRVVTRADDASSASAMSEPVIRELCDRLGGLILGEGDVTMACVLGQLLRQAGQTLASAESCTGGMIGQLLTAAPGASEYYLGGVVSYSNSVKQELMGVPADLLATHGAVSEPVAKAMAEGCLARLGSDWAVSVTGIAGPGGGSDEKPVGLVWIALAGRNFATQAWKSIFPGSREMIRLRSSLAAMNYLRLELRARAGRG